jgi:hypothetical protein
MTVKPRKVPFQWAPFLICLVIAVTVIVWVFFHTGRLPAPAEVTGLVTAAVALLGGVGSHFGLSKVALSHDAGIIDAKYSQLEPFASAVETAVPALQSQVEQLGTSIDQKVAEGVKAAVAELPLPAQTDVDALAEIVKAKILSAVAGGVTGPAASPAVPGAPTAAGAA